MKLNLKLFLLLKNITYQTYDFLGHAKGNATENSDIDLIMDTGGIIGFIKYSLLVHKLEDVFDCSIDLITNEFSNKEFLKKIKKEEVLLYER